MHLPIYFNADPTPVLQPGMPVASANTTALNFEESIIGAWRGSAVSCISTGSQNWVINAAFIMFASFVTVQGFGTSSFGLRHHKQGSRFNGSSSGSI
jgi:hypothetical protein